MAPTPPPPQGLKEAIEGLIAPGPWPLDGHSVCTPGPTWCHSPRSVAHPGPNFPGQPRDTVGTKSVQSRGICPDPAPLLPRGRVGTNVDTFVPGQLSRHYPGTIVPQLLLPGPDSDPGQIQMKSSQCKIIKISINSFQALRSLRY